MMILLNILLEFLVDFLMLPKFFLNFVEELFFFPKIIELEICVAHGESHL